MGLTALWMYERNKLKNNDGNTVKRFNRELKIGILDVLYMLCKPGLHCTKGLLQFIFRLLLKHVT